MYGTIPIAASFSKGGIKDDWLAAFMMSSILLNPQLIVYSGALGPTVLAVRIVSCFLCGIGAGVLLRVFYKEKPFFNFTGFEPRKSHDTDPNLDALDARRVALFSHWRGAVGGIPTVHPGGDYDRLVRG